MYQEILITSLHEAHDSRRYKDVHALSRLIAGRCMANRGRILNTEATSKCNHDQILAGFAALGYEGGLNASIIHYEAERDRVIS